MSDGEREKKRKIVSSRHLANSEGWQLSEFEYGLIIAYNGFSRWMSKCMQAAGNLEMSSLDILVLHHINHRAKQKKLSDICFLLNIEDSHTVNYAIKKLLKAQLIEGNKLGKEMYYSTTKSGYALCDKYREIREQCLLDSLTRLNINPDDLSEFAAVLRTLSGLYDQASRSASSL
ncbi:MAG: winged helix DNA-binding protein [Granulosicoccus sp.]